MLTDQVPATRRNHWVSSRLALGDPHTASRHAFARCAEAWAGEDFIHQPHKGKTGGKAKGEHLIFVGAVETDHVVDGQATALAE